jgi:hypothetical protein
MVRTRLERGGAAFGDPLQDLVGEPGIVDGAR